MSRAEACTTIGCERPATVAGTFHEEDQDYRVTYCSECAESVSDVFEPARPTAPAAEAGDELRDRLIAELPRHVDVIAPVAEGFEVGCRCGWTGSTYLHGWGEPEARTEYRRHKADALLAPLLQRLVAEAAEAARLREFVQRVEALAGEWERLDAYSAKRAADLLAALDGGQ